MPLKRVRAEGTKTSLEIDRKLWHDAKVRAAIEDIDLRELVERALRAYMYGGPVRALKFKDEQHKAIWRERVNAAKKGDE